MTRQSGGRYSPGFPERRVRENEAYSKSLPDTIPNGGT
jgi:hypothetical protein